MIIHEPYLIILGRSGVQWPAQKQLSHHTPETPDINRLAKRQPEQNLRCAVVARLEISGLHGLADMRRRAEIDHLYFIGLSDGIDQHDVLGLEIGVNEAEFFQLAQGEQHLLHDRTYAFERERRELVLFQEIVQVLLEHLENQTCVVLVLKDLVGSHEVVLVRVLLAQP